MEIEKQDFDLRVCIEDVLDVFGTKAAHIGLDLVYKIDENVPPQIVGDNLRLRQILTNLIGNALKFTQKGEVFVGVHLLSSSSTTGEMQLEFEVRDSGIGIPQEKLHRLFKAFSQVDSSTTRKYGGTGLGLAISEKLVKLMGGEIRVESEEGIGSTFSFSISTEKGIKVLPCYTHYNLADQEGKRILVVDDNLTNRAILKNQLELWNLVPILASSGKEALEILDAQNHFDLVLTDMQMPYMDGIQLGNSLKEKYPALPVILLSSMGDDYTHNNLNLFSSVLTKPARQHVLCKHILSALQNQLPVNSDLVTTEQKMASDFALHHPFDILIAEDNLINQQVILHILGRMGYNAEVVENGLQALEVLHHKPFDIVLMDMQMPEMDGLEATKAIRGSLGPQPVIIALTANTMQGDEEECLKAGMNDYISKPVKPEDIQQKLEKWSAKRKIDRKAA
ncbi:MAG: response regulator [Chitinophagaceae bacterium]|nr:MAG: response regulator [Chitinophagaceae bacterium]